MTDAIIRHRLWNQQITQPQFDQAADVVAWFGAVQGQDYAGAKWAVGLRTKHGTEAAVEQAIAQGKIYRTWLMRGTLHLVTPQDIHLILMLVASRMVSGAASRHRQLEIEREDVEKVSAILRQVLADGQSKTRRELFVLLESQHIPTTGQRGIHLLQLASYDGVIRQGNADRNNPSFFLLEPPSKPLPDRPDALAELARRYFFSRGPATVQDFATWASLPLGEARQGLEAVQPQLVSETFGGVTYWSPNVDLPARPAPGVHLLSTYEEYLLGYKDRAAVLDPQHANAVVPGGNGVFFPIVVSAGRVVGTWKKEVKKGALTISASSFERFNETERAGLEIAAHKYGQYIGLPASLG